MGGCGRSTPGTGSGWCKGLGVSPLPGARDRKHARWLQWLLLLPAWGPRDEEPAELTDSRGERATGMAPFTRPYQVLGSWSHCVLLHSMGDSLFLCKMGAACSPGSGIQEVLSKWKPLVVAIAGAGLCDPRAQSFSVLPSSGDWATIICKLI